MERPLIRGVAPQKRDQAAYPTLGDGAGGRSLGSIYEQALNTISISSVVVSNKNAPTMGPYEWITKETLVYRHSYLNPMSAVFDDVTNCDAGFD